MGQANSRSSRENRIKIAKEQLAKRELNLACSEVMILSNLTPEEQEGRERSLNRLSLFMGYTIDSLTVHDKREKAMHETSVGKINEAVKARLAALSETELKEQEDAAMSHVTEISGAEDAVIISEETIQ